MKINITGHQIDLTDAMQAHVRDKLKRIERHFDHVTEANVVLQINRHEHRAEATIHPGTGRGAVFADATRDDMYQAIDAMVHRLDRQVIKQKEKLKDHHNEPLKTAIV